MFIVGHIICVAAHFVNSLWRVKGHRWEKQTGEIEKLPIETHKSCNYRDGKKKQPKVF